MRQRVRNPSPTPARRVARDELEVKPFRRRTSTSSNRVEPSRGRSGFQEDPPVTLMGEEQTLQEFTGWDEAEIPRAGEIRPLQELQQKRV